MNRLDYPLKMNGASTAEFSLRRTAGLVGGIPPRAPCRPPTRSIRQQISLPLPSPLDVRQDIARQFRRTG